MPRVSKHCFYSLVLYIHIQLCCCDRTTWRWQHALGSTPTYTLCLSPTCHEKKLLGLWQVSCIMYSLPSRKTPWGLAVFRHGVCGVFFQPNYLIMSVYIQWVSVVHVLEILKGGTLNRRHTERTDPHFLTSSYTVRFEGYRYIPWIISVIIELIRTVWNDNDVLDRSAFEPRSVAADKQRLKARQRQRHNRGMCNHTSTFQESFHMHTKRPFVFAVGVNIIRYAASAINVSVCSSLRPWDNKTRMEISRQHD